MKLWRLDAMHECEDAEGALCLFFTHELDARVRERGLAVCGWMTDVYLDEIDHLSAQELSHIVAGPWPLVPSGVVLRIVRTALETELLELAGAHV